MNNDSCYITGAQFASEVMTLKNFACSTQAQANCTEMELNRLRDEIIILENKMKTIENLLGITFGENGTIKVMKEKK